jgi:hypothetical protein
MQFFVCAYCDHIDAVELCPHNATIPSHGDWMCTCCADKPWHNHFAYRPYDVDIDFMVVNRPTGLGFG